MKIPRQIYIFVKYFAKLGPFLLSFPLCNAHAGTGGSYPQGIVRPIFRRMKIVISGIGEMGSHLAKMLSGHGHDITVIDSDSKALDDWAVSSI